MCVGVCFIFGQSRHHPVILPNLSVCYVIALIVAQWEEMIEEMLENIKENKEICLALHNLAESPTTYKTNTGWWI